MTVTYNRIEALEREADGLKTAYLRRWGWSATCHTPGAYWLWVRDWKADDDAALARWHECNAKREIEVIENGRPYTPNSPNPPKPYGVVSAPTDLAIQMTLRSIDDRPELGNCDD